MSQQVLHWVVAAGAVLFIAVATSCAPVGVPDPCDGIEYSISDASHHVGACHKDSNHASTQMGEPHPGGTPSIEHVAHNPPPAPPSPHPAPNPSCHPKGRT